MPKPDFSVSVVGSRKASPYGKEVTKRFVSAFVRHGAAIVSGGAA
ncbi:MAG: DNA-processing protein DprA [Patescibacteria group bacterium]